MRNNDYIAIKPRLSVIVPLYNSEKYIFQCLNSLFRQTLRPNDYEVIIVDDCSTDNSYLIAKEYIKSKSNFRLFKNKKNIGQGLTRNIALKKALGEYIYFLDSDDYIDPVALENMLLSAYNDDSDVVTSGFHRVFEDGEIEFSINENNLFAKSKIELLRNYVSLKISPMNCNRLIKKDLIEQFSIIYRSGKHEDVSFIFKIFLFAKKISYVNDYYYYWVKHEKSITNTISKSHIDGFVQGLEEIRREVQIVGGNSLKRQLANDLKIGCSNMIRTLVYRIINYEKSSKDSFDLLKYLVYRLKDFPELKESIEAYSSTQIISVFRYFSYGNISLDYHYSRKYKSKIKLIETHVIEEKKSFKLDNNLNFYNKIKKHFLIISSKERLIEKILYFTEKLGGLIQRKSYEINVKYNNDEKRIKNKLNIFLKKFENKIVFCCDVDYQLRNAFRIANNLKNLGYQSVIVDNSKHHLNGIRSLSPEEYQEIGKGLEIIDSNEYFKENMLKISPRILVAITDINYTNILIRKLSIRQIPTLVINEGVSDYYKLINGFSTQLYPYRTSEYIILPGEYDKRFFEDRKEKVFVSGLPMVRKLYEEKEVKFPEKPLAVINVNFSYGVLTDKRDLFVKTAVEGCKLAGIDYILTQHPADNGDLSDYNVTTDNMYDSIRNGTIFISRFSGAIIESLALGKPVVYHNPIGENVIKFQEPLGAYSISTDSKTLAKAIKTEIKKAQQKDVRTYANKFLELHAYINSEKPPEEMIAEHIIKIAKRRKINK